MRLAQINLPTLDNNGASLDHVHKALQHHLCEVFGGFTAFDAQGAWVDAGKLYHEAVTVYQIAIEPDHISRNNIRAIATRAGKFANQIAVYIVIDGETEIITI